MKKYLTLEIFTSRSLIWKELLSKNLEILKVTSQSFWMFL